MGNEISKTERMVVCVLDGEDCLHSKSLHLDHIPKIVF